MTKVEYERMTPGEIVEARRRCPAILFPIGPLEWHGPHLPLGTDAIHAYELAARAARRIGCLTLPMFWLGTDALRPPGGGPQSLGALGFSDDERIVGMDYPQHEVKSLYLDEAVLGVVVREIVRGIAANGFRLVIIVNGHGAPNHRRALMRIADQESDPPRLRVVFTQAGAQPLRPDADPGHAERWETASMLSLAPDLVRKENLPPLGEPLRYDRFGIVNGQAFEGHPNAGFVLPDADDPRHSTKEDGDKLMASKVEWLTAAIQGYLAALAGAPERV